MKKTAAGKGKGADHVAIVLDMSGSMSSVRAETISGFNEQLQATKKAATRKTLVTVCAFNEEVLFRAFEEPVKAVKLLTRDSYEPFASTAMYDAVGSTLEKLGDKESDTYLVVIISDGLENASRTFNAVKVAKMIRSRQKTARWTFAYMGSNQDLSQATDLGIFPGNVAMYSSSAAGTADAFATIARSTVVRAQGLAAGQTMTAAFYGSTGKTKI